MPNAFIPQDDKGNLLRVADMASMTEPWIQTLDPIKNMYRAYLGNEVRGIYLHGSVVRGSAKPHISDIDTFCLTHDSPAILNLSWISEAQRNLERQFPFAKSIDLRLGSQHDIEKDMRYTMIVKILSVCIDGDDICDELPAIVPNESLARQLTQDFARKIARAQMLLSSMTHPDEIRQVCRWSMKQIVRAGFRLVIPHEQQYTLHLETAAHTFIKYYPEKAADMLHAFHLAHNPTDNKEEILHLVNGLGVWLVQKIESELQS